jgi:NADPH:quinone reductase-like Zn-dependent oxidoreductase
LETERKGASLEEHLKAVIYAKRDSRKFLELLDIDTPSPKQGEVLIKT